MRGGAAGRWRRRLLEGALAVGVLGVLVAAGWIWLASRRPPEPPPVAAAPASPSPPAVPPSPPDGGGSGAGGPDDPEIPPAVQRYLEATVYPPSSGILRPGAADLLEPNQRYERLKPVPSSRGAEPPLRFLWTADRYHYTSDEVVRARFEAQAGDGPAAVRQLEAWAQPEGGAGAIGPAVALQFRVESGAHLADLSLAGAFAEHHGPVLLGVRYAVADQPPQEEAIRIFVTPASGIPARFTGSVRDDVREGSLVVEVGIEVADPGFYRIDANLYEAAGEPVAWATFKGDLAERDGVVPLQFFGKVLRDGGAPGPYSLGELRGYRFRDGLFPDRAHLRSWPGRWETRAWSLADLSDAEWDGAQRRRMVELLLEDYRAGLSLDVPPAAVPGAAAP